jgi:hypothetical protein
MHDDISLSPCGSCKCNPKSIGLHVMATTSTWLRVLNWIARIALTIDRDRSSAGPINQVPTSSLFNLGYNKATRQLAIFFADLLIKSTVRSPEHRGPWPCNSVLEYPAIRYGDDILPPFQNIRCFRFTKQIYLHILMCIFKWTYILKNT